MTDEELKELVASLAVVQRENERAAAEQRREAAEQHKQTEKAMQDTGKAMQEWRELHKETERAIQELTEQQKQTDKQQKQTDKQLKELGKQIGGLGNKFGTLTEGMAFPSMERLLHERFGMETILPNAKRYLGEEMTEIDVLAYNNSEKNEVFIVEVKSHLDPADLGQVLKLLNNFPRFFPEHANKKLYGIVAAVNLVKDMKEKVLATGLYFARIRDDHFALQVPKGFKAKSFS